jgi:chromate reductase, NAD(P)H dehydrogenase (quinone)
MRVCGIAGSLRKASYNRALLRAAIELAPPAMEIVPFDRLRDVPLYDGDVEAAGDPEAVAALKAAIRSADALLVVTPEYNYGVPGVLKNAIDWASRPPTGSVLSGKPAAILGASPGRTGTARAQLALRQSFVFTQTLVMPGPEVLVAEAAKRFSEDGRLTDETTRRSVRELLERFAAWATRLCGRPG